MTSDKKEKKSFGKGMVVVPSGIKTEKICGGRRCFCTPGSWGAGSSSTGGCACGCGGLISPDFAADNNGANFNVVN